jgi:CheY-like chemotaxis protein
MTKKILIAEDDRSLASSIGRALEGDGYACHFATDGVDALRKALSVEPDLIILDLLLPKKDGRSVLRELRAKSKKMPVIAISGVFRGRSAAEELRELGANEFLDKPFTVRVLLEKTLELVGPAEEPEGEDAKIRLTDQTPAEILWRLMSSGFSGAVQFQRDKLHKVIVLEDGKLRLIRSNSARECLGRRLLAAGRIDRAALDESLRLCRDDGKRQGEVFVDLGLMTTEEVDAELEAQAADKLLSFFNWEHGEAWAQAGVNSLSHASPIDHWAPRALILFGAQRMTTAQVARYLNPLGDAPLYRVEIGLDAEELHAPGVTEFFNALESGATLADHLDQHGRAIYGLRLVGALRIGDASDESGAGDPKVSELQKLCAQMQGQGFFEILGVTEQAAASEIRRAFLRKAKSYHPDRFSSESEAARKVAGEIFSLLSSAHDTLTDKDARTEYLARLERGSETGHDHREIVMILRAESLFRDAESHLKRRDYARAGSLLRAAVELNPKEGEFCALMGWCHFLEHREEQQAVAQAITALEQAIQLSPGSASGYYYMAKLHKARERHAEASTMFRKVLEIDPKHQEAMREVRLASMRNQKKGGSGLFGFGRKK